MKLQRASDSRGLSSAAEGRWQNRAPGVDSQGERSFQGKERSVMSHSTEKGRKVRAEKCLLAFMTRRLSEIGKDCLQGVHGLDPNSRGWLLRKGCMCRHCAGATADTKRVG